MRHSAPLGELLSSNSQAAEARTLQDVEREHILRALNESSRLISGPSGAAAKLGLKQHHPAIQDAKVGDFPPSLMPRRRSDYRTQKKVFVLK